MGKHSKQLKRKFRLIRWDKRPCYCAGCKREGDRCSYPWGGHIYLCAEHRPVYGFCYDCGKFFTTDPDPDEDLVCDRCAGYFEDWDAYEPAPESDAEHEIKYYEESVRERWQLGEGMSDQ